MPPLDRSAPLWERLQEAYETAPLPPTGTAINSFAWASVIRALAHDLFPDGQTHPVRSYLFQQAEQAEDGKG